MRIASWLTAPPHEQPSDLHWHGDARANASCIRSSPHSCNTPVGAARRAARAQVGTPAGGPDDSAREPLPVLEVVGVLAPDGDGACAEPEDAPDTRDLHAAHHHATAADEVVPRPYVAGGRASLHPEAAGAVGCSLPREPARAQIRA
jgi:hypothetical protein